MRTCGRGLSFHCYPWETELYPNQREVSLRCLCIYCCLVPRRWRSEVISVYRCCLLCAVMSSTSKKPVTNEPFHYPLRHTSMFSLLTLFWRSSGHRKEGPVSRHRKEEPACVGLSHSTAVRTVQEGKT